MKKSEFSAKAKSGKIVDEILISFRDDLSRLQSAVDTLHPNEYTCSQINDGTYSFKIECLVTGLYTITHAEKWEWDIEETLAYFRAAVSRRHHGNTSIH